MIALAADGIVAVIGAGTMGAGIAQVAAAAGHRVFLFDARADAAPKARQGIDAALAKLVARGKLDHAAQIALVGRIRVCDTLTETKSAALVIEAIVENLDTKRALFAELETIVDEGAILASNTSSLSITAMGAGLKRPGRVVGMHFFNPAPLMALVEVASGMATERAVADQVFATAQAWGKHPVHTRSTPGFIVNRVARPFYGEALKALLEGAGDCATLDAVMHEAGGFRMGPFELMDLIGLDVNYAVTCSVYEAFFHDPRYTPSLIQQEMVAAGFLGRKSGRGFYRYDANALPANPHTAPAAAPPVRVVAVGDPGPLEALLPLIAERGMSVRRDDTDVDGDGWLELDGRVAVALSDGRGATERMARMGGRPLVLIDLALDYATASRIALAPADRTAPAELALVVGLFQALGKAVSVLDDTPGMIVLRTVCMLANEGADAVHQGVCGAAAVDEAMQKGVNYPLGPLAWADAIGLERVVRALDHLAAAHGVGRYRVSPLLRRKVYGGGRLR